MPAPDEHWKLPLHNVVIGAKLFVGHVELVPVHVSAWSHIPVLALHVVPLRYLSMHVLDVPLQ
jgi:hypothetical protein